MKRTGDDVNSASYSTTDKCQTIGLTESIPTYAVAKPVDSSNKVDVYDGFNSHTKSVTDGYLESYPYFTDTMRDQTGTDRQAFFTLAPNSVTKVRIYIYIEGQDIDNYDYASIGKQISVAFGFTKQRFTEDDINYTGPRPVINGADDKTITAGTAFNPLEGVTVVDADGVTDITSRLTSTGVVDVDVPGTYTVTYRARNVEGMAAEIVERIITVQ